MTQVDARFVIVGGGLAGLCAAHELERLGNSDHVLLEARPCLGGRIQSLSPQRLGPVEDLVRHDRFDLGATWFWPALQPELTQLITTLGLTRFEQFEVGDMLLERSPNDPPVRTSGYTNSPPSVRVVGGMAALVEALHGRLTGGRIVVDRQVHELRCEGPHVVVVSADSAGHVHELRAEKVLLATPPRLVHEHIRFSPALPASLARQWRDTATWMAPHAKYVAVYDMPFWRELGLSGHARSARGPMGEIHDASMPGGSAALFGFLGIPAAMRRGVPEGALLAHCRAQLTRLFGPQAATPKAEFIKDWAQDGWTATATDLTAPAAHASAPAALVSVGGWQGRIVGVASEWSPQFPGYVAGAIEAARMGVQSVLLTGVAPL